MEEVIGVILLASANFDFGSFQSREQCGRVFVGILGIFIGPKILLWVLMCMQCIIALCSTDRVVEDHTLEAGLASE